MTLSRFSTLPYTLHLWDDTATAQDVEHLLLAVLPRQRYRSVSIFICFPRVRAPLEQHFCHALATIFRGQVQRSRTLAVCLEAIGIHIYDIPSVKVIDVLRQGVYEF